MLRYRLDELGWWAFEQLVQSLLKAKFGLAIEAWSGVGDHGIDAWCRAYMDHGETKPGPHVFQVKFIEGANAAGARPREKVVNATTKEIARIAARQGEWSWKGLVTYTFVTNAPLSIETRKEIRDRFQRSIPGCEIQLQGGSDVCALLDQNRDVLRSFQILGLADLDHLLATVINRDVAVRSKALLRLALESAGRFVSTKVYVTASEVLARHHLLLLDGPPEMGKTTVANMLSLMMIADGWHAVDCRDSSDFFRVYEEKRRQLFVFDDVFGRTQYDPAVGIRWERDIERVLSHVDEAHAFIFTSRKQVLLRALETLDFGGAARSFPAPEIVVVASGDLTEQDKAMILYRHAKIGASAPMRRAIRPAAAEIVNHSHFTPERVRRLVDAPSAALREAAGKGDFTLAKSLIHEAMIHPTKAMVLAFGRLSAHARLVF